MNEKLLLGEPAVDQEHQKLFESFERIRLAHAHADPEETLSNELSKLGEQLCQHFSTEEVLMTRLGVPEHVLRGHRKSHELILEEFAQIHLDAMYGKKIAIAELIASVARWISGQIVDFDLPLKSYIGGAIQAKSKSSTELR